MDERRTQVIIAGGSVAGLSLANMLQRINVDYLILEKHREIAPSVGASIGIFPNGGRLLDQLGCYEKLQELMQGTSSFGTLSLANEKGKVIQSVPEAGKLFLNHFGYEPLFADRQMLLQMLYDNLQDKDKVLLSEGVSAIEQSSGSVLVTTQSGKKFRGEILVGADGVHSFVRREMWRLADAERPGYFPMKDRVAVTYHYNCIFGISKPLEDFPKSCSFNIFGKRYSYLVASGPGERIYWFLFKKLVKERRISADEIPHYTKVDRDQLAAEHANDAITEKISFKDVYDNHTSATLTALPEKVYSKWHYGRIITIGDAAHKFNPIGGQGGNSAMETAATLTNELNALYSSKENRDKSPLSLSEVTTAFRNTESKRHAHVSGVMDVAHTMQKLFALESVFSRLLVKFVLPFTKGEQIVDQIGSNIKAVTMLDMLDIPARPHYNLYDDERPAKPWRYPALLTSIGTIVFAGIIFAASRYMDPPISPDSWKDRDFFGIPTRTVWTGTGFDEVLTMIVTMFADSIGWNDVGHTLQAAYLLYMLLPIFVIWYVEAYRKGNASTLISLPVLFGVAMNFRGIGMIGPIYGLFFVWTTHGNAGDTIVHRKLPPAIAKAILPATLIGYLLPTVLIFWPSSSPEPLQTLVVLWQFAAVAVSILVSVFARLLRSQSGSTDTFFRSSDHANVTQLTVVTELYRTYEVIFLLSSIVHISMLCTCIFSGSPALDLQRLIIPHLNIVTGVEEPDKGFSLMFTFLKWDCAFAAAYLLALGLYSIIHMRWFGLITTATAARLSTQFLLAQVVLGPRAAIIWQWWQREKVLALGGVFETVEQPVKLNGHAQDEKAA